MEFPKEIVPAIQEQMTTADLMLESVEVMEITNTRSFTIAAEDLVRLRIQEEDLETTRKSLTSPLRLSEKRINDCFRQPLKYLRDATLILKRKMGEYEAKLELSRDKAQARMSDFQKQAETSLMDQACDEYMKGNADKAEDLMMEAQYLVPATAIHDDQPSGNVYKVKTWRAEIVDKRKIIEGVLARAIPEGVIDIDMAIPNRVAKSLKENFKWPGFRSISKIEIRVRKPKTTKPVKIGSRQPDEDPNYEN